MKERIGNLFSVSAIIGFALLFAVLARAQTEVIGLAGSPWKRQTVTYSATPTFDLRKASAFQITLTGNASATISGLVGATDGKLVSFIICQDLSGNRSFSYPSNVYGASDVDALAGWCTAQTFTVASNELWAVGEAAYGTAQPLPSLLRAPLVGAAQVNSSALIAANEKLGVKWTATGSPGKQLTFIQKANGIPLNAPFAIQAGFWIENLSETAPTQFGLSTYEHDSFNDQGRRSFCGYYYDPTSESELAAGSWAAFLAYESSFWAEDTSRDALPLPVWPRIGADALATFKPNALSAYMMVKLWSDSTDGRNKKCSYSINGGVTWTEITMTSANWANYWGTTFSDGNKWWGVTAQIPDTSTIVHLTSLQKQ